MDKRPPTRAELCGVLEQIIAHRDEILGENARLSAEIERQAGEIAELKAELERWGPGGTQPAPWIRANSPPRLKNVRHKRQANFARAWAVATRQVIHAVDACPDCGYRLGGGSTKRHREIIEISQTPAVVTHHVLIERTCLLCAKRCVPTLGVADGVADQHHFEPR